MFSETTPDIGSKPVMVLSNGKLIDLVNYPWYLKDRNGWPIEQEEGKYFHYILKVIIQNIRKLL